MTFEGQQVRSPAKIRRDVGLASGFVFLGPFLAMGLYSISYQLENGRHPTLSFSLQEGRAHLRDTLMLGLLPAHRSARVGTCGNDHERAVGAMFCAIVFAATAFSLPMIVTAVLIGFATMFLGFIVLMPLIGHATWHAYRRTIDATLWPTTHP